MNDTSRRLADIERRIGAMSRPMSGAERDDLARAQARADSVARMFGGSASAPLPGETSVDYRRRMAAKFAPYSKRFAGARFDALDAATLAPIEDMIYSDAVAAAKSPDRAQPGQIIPVQEVDMVGRTITRFIGDPLAWMAPMMSAGQVGHFIRPGDK